MWRGVVSHSRDIVEQSFSASPAQPFAADVSHTSVPFAADASVCEAGRPQEERIETLSRVQKCGALLLAPRRLNNFCKKDSNRIASRVLWATC